MPHNTTTLEKRRRALALAAFGLVAVTTVAVGIVLAQSETSSARAVIEVPEQDPDLPPPGAEGPGEATGSPRGAVSEADGALPDGASVFDDYPGIAGLRPELLDALRAAAADAGESDIEFVVNSGWRSPEYQTRLLRDAIADYGSEEEAARWVATPQTSAHVSGDAVDIGGMDATDWLSIHGAAYGLCQIYGNESWHFELRPEAPATGCPPMYTDPTKDPRMRQ